MTEIDQKELLTRRRWKTRRLMAWFSMWSLLLITVGAFLWPDGLDKSSGTLGALILAFAGIVGGYIGTSVLDDKWHKPKDI